MFSLAERAALAKQSLSEALAAGKHMPPAQPQGAPPQQQQQQGALAQPAPQPAPGPPPGALGGGMPPVRPGMSPLEMMPSFKSAPMAAALQGGEGMKAQMPSAASTGFARGGLVVRVR